MTGKTSSLLKAATLLTGPTIWAGHFLTVYASESLLCRVAAEHWHTLFVIIATAVALGLIAAHARMQQIRFKGGEVDRFRVQTTLTLNSLSALAIGLAVMAGIALPACR
jgi:hypothetical protein